MLDIEMQEVTPAFLDCWRAAGAHLNNQVQDGIQSWIRAHPYPPFLEHLSFRLGNQLFFVRVEDVDGVVEAPGSLLGLQAAAVGNGGHACVMSMRRTRTGEWLPDRPGWGLVDSETGKAVDPVFLVSDEMLEMTDWEIHDTAVQVVRDYLLKQGHELMSWQGNPSVDPAIWFIGDSKGPEWVVVRAARFPEKEAMRPTNWLAIVSGCKRMSHIGHFASVALVSTDQPFASEAERAVPLWRGHGMYIRFSGLDSGLNAQFEIFRS